jgi:uncharacterized phage-like protein YoqJ
MPKVRDVLTHVSVECAARVRICHRNRAEHSITKGDKCLVVRDPSTQGSKNYCGECSKEIIQAARMRLAEIEQQLL